MSTVIEPPVQTTEKHLEEVETVTIRFAGDSGDGMQLTGTQFTNTAVVGNDISTLPDFPAEIRACRQLAGRKRFSIELFQSGHQDARRPTQRFGGNESGGAESEPSGSRRWWHADHQYGRIHEREPEVRELRDQST